MRQTLIIFLISLIAISAFSKEGEAIIFGRKVISGTSNVPLPPQGRKLKSEEHQLMVNGRKGESGYYWYRSKAMPDEIINFYKEALTREGWVGREAGNKNQILFVKDGAWIAVACQRHTEGSDIFIQHIPKIDMPAMRLDVDEDAPGRDPDWLVRYPGSVRMLCAENLSQGGVTLTYRSGGEAQDILKFYKEKMRNAGWEALEGPLTKSKFSQRIAKVMKTSPLYFRSPKGICFINVVHNDQLDSSFISVVYNPVVMGE